MKTSRLSMVLSGLMISAAVSPAADAMEMMTCPGVQPAPFAKIYVAAMSGMSGGPASDPRYRKKDTPLTCRDVTEVATVIRSVNAMVGTQIATPRSLELDFVKMEGNAFSAGPAFLHLPREVVFNELSKNPVFTRPVWAHEYGHSLFMNDMARRNPQAAVLAQLMNRYIDNTLSMLDLSERYDQSVARQEKCEKAKNPACVAAEEKFRAELAPAMEKVGKQSERLQEQLEPFSNLLEASGSFNEFFADVVAVSLTGKPDAVKNSLFRTKSWQDRPRSRNKQDCYSCRDFSARENSLQNWIAWKTRSRGDTSSLPTGSHDILAPSRYHLWTQYMKAGPGLFRRAELLRRVLDSIAEMLPTVVLGLEKGESLDPIELNRLFIHVLDQNVGRMR